MSVKHSLLAFGALHVFPSYCFQATEIMFFAELPSSRQSPTFKVCLPAIVLTTPWKACYVLRYNLPSRKLEGTSRCFQQLDCFFVNTLVPEDISILRLSCERGSQAHSTSCRRLVPKTHARGIDCDHDGFISSNVAWTFWRLVCCTWFLNPDGSPY